DEKNTGEKSSAVAGDLEDIANLLIDEGNYAEAESKLKVAIEILEKDPEATDKTFVVYAKLALGRCLMHQDKRLDEAVKLLSETEFLFEQADIDNEAYAMRVAQTYDQTLKKLGRAKEADEFNQRISVARKNAYGGAYAPL
ncbi:MAG: hypothetical protein K2X81_03665, partial [Candidatus Obscuribacterales bacterium]|nr:hypothetical protein [Candidatus Obscuribacterales bacterium]